MNHELLPIIPTIPLDLLTRPSQDRRYVQKKVHSRRLLTFDAKMESETNALNEQQFIIDAAAKSGLPIVLWEFGSAIYLKGEKKNNNFISDLDFNVFIDRDHLWETSMSFIIEKLGFTLDQTYPSPQDEEDLQTGKIDVLEYSTSKNGVKIEIHFSTFESLKKLFSKQGSHERVERRKSESDIDLTRVRQSIDMNGKRVYLREPYFRIRRYQNSSRVDAIAPGALYIPPRKKNSKGTFTPPYYLQYLFPGEICFDGTTSQSGRSLESEIWHNLIVTVLRSHKLCDKNDKPLPKAFHPNNHHFILKPFLKRRKFTEETKQNLIANYLTELNNLQIPLMSTS